MAKLPTRDNLSGAVSMRSGRQIATYDTTAIGRGIAEAGAALSGLGAQIREKDNALDIARAEAYKTKGLLDVQNEFDVDPDYSTFKQRAPAKTGEVVKNAANLIRDPYMRQKWALGAQNDAARYSDSILDRGVTLGRQAEVVALDDALEINRRLYVDPDTPEEVKAKARADIEGTLATAEATGLLTPDMGNVRRKVFLEDADLTRGELAVDRDWKVIPGRYAGAVDAVTNRIIGNESGGDPNAQNSRSSAGGLGGFIDSTWVATVRKYRPDIARGMSNDDIIGLKKGDPALAVEMTRRLTEENAAFLARNGKAVTPANLYLAHFAGQGGAQKVLSADDATPLVSVLDSAAIRANPEVLGGGKTVGDLKRWTEQEMGGADLFGGPVPPVQFIDDTAGKIRSKPVQSWVKDGIARAAGATDPRIAIKIVSGGQNPLGVGGPRTGSTRHDDGNSADIVLLVDGKPVLPGQDKALYANFLRNAAAAGMTGLGHYSWGIHVGGGSKAAWGPDTTGKTLDPVFAKAINDGWASRGTSAGPDWYQRLSPERQADLQSRAIAQQQSNDASNAAKLKAEQAAAKDNYSLRIATMDPSLSERAILSDPVLDNGDKAALINTFNTKMEESGNVAAALQQFAAGQLMVDPFDEKARKTVDKMYDRALTAVPPEQVQPLTEEVVRQTGVVPKAAMNAIRAGVQSTDIGSVTAALQAAQRLSAVNPAALSRRDGGGEVQGLADDFAHYVRDLNLSPEDAARRIMDARDPAKKMARKAMEPAAKEFVKSMEKTNIADAFDTWLGAEPDVGFTPGQALGIQAEFLALAEDAFYASNGDPALAKNRAVEEMKRLYGVTGITGRKVVMKHPPERYWPQFSVMDSAQSLSYRAQLEGDLKAIDPSVDMSKVQLVTTPETDAMIKRGEMPGYAVLYQDANGDYQSIPGKLWLPDLTRVQEMQGNIDAAEQKAREDAARARQESERVKATQTLEGRDRDKALDNFLDGPVFPRGTPAPELPPVVNPPATVDDVEIPPQNLVP